MKRKPDPLLRTQPWKITLVFGPLERVLHRLEMDGTIDAAGRHYVFKEDGTGGWYDLIAAMRGVIEFHEIAGSRYGLHVDLGPMERFAKKLEMASPVFESDIAAVRTCIAACKAQAMQLRLSQAEGVLQTVRISMGMDQVRRAA